MKEEQTTEAKSREDIKKDIDRAETELRTLFDNLIYEHCDNAGQYELDNLASGFNTLLKYARKWQESQKDEHRMDDVEKLLELYKYGKGNDKQEKSNKPTAGEDKK